MIFPNNAAILGIFVGILNGIPLPPSLRDPLEIGTLHVRFYRYIFTVSHPSAGTSAYL
jgi:hypothetical protein